MPKVNFSCFLAALNKVFNEEPESLSVHLRDTAMFACDIGGAPPPTVHWYKDELEIDTQNVNYHIHFGGVLEIRSVQFAEFGRYRCKAENPERSRLSEVAELTQDSNVGKDHTLQLLYTRLIFRK